MSVLKLANCGLLRTPKVYNALITTDENISPSRSYPIIQPHIHETGLAYPAYPFGGYNPFNVYDPYSPFSAGPSINPAFIGRNNVPIGFPTNEQRNHLGRPHADDQSFDDNNSETNDNPQEENPGNPSNEPNLPPPPASDQITDDSPKQPDNALNANSNNSEKSPIPLNEFGLPPSLIPVNPYGNNYQPQPNPINLAPYAYNSYPLAFDHFNGYQPNPYLPPFGYYPQPLDFSQLASNNNRRYSKSGNQPPLPASQSQPSPNSIHPQQPPPPKQQPKLPPSPNPQESLSGPAVVPLDDIKNFPKKNKDIPDVPPPPLPSGAKTSPADE